MSILPIPDDGLAEVREAIFAKRYPAWWHIHGITVTIGSASPDQLYLRSYCSQLVIAPSGDGWRVDWAIFFNSLDPDTCGHRWLTSSELAQAFDVVPQSGATIVVRPGDFLADAYADGRFIRSGSFLNIPGPGSGGDHDPNLSLYLTPNIRQAVATLFARS